MELTIQSENQIFKLTPDLNIYDQLFSLHRQGIDFDNARFFLTASMLKPNDKKLESDKRKLAILLEEFLTDVERLAK